MRYFLLAGITLALLAATATAGPIRERFAANRGANSCSSGAASCTTAPVAACAPKVAAPTAAETVSVRQHRPVRNALAAAFGRCR